MREIGETYEDLLKKHVSAKETTIPFYSSVTGYFSVAKARLGPAYWRSSLESPVLFNTAVQELLDDLRQDTVFLEIGPHSALQGPLRQIFQEYSGKFSKTYVPTLIRGDDVYIHAHCDWPAIYSWLPSQLFVPQSSSTHCGRCPTLLLGSWIRILDRKPYIDRMEAKSSLIS